MSHFNWKTKTKTKAVSTRGVRIYRMSCISPRVHMLVLVHDGQPKSRNFSIRECRTAHAHTHTHTHLLSISSPVIKSVKRSPKPWFSVHPSHISCRINANRNAQQQSRSHENKLKYANIKKKLFVRHSPDSDRNASPLNVGEGCNWSLILTLTLMMSGCKSYCFKRANWNINLSSRRLKQLTVSASTTLYW